MQFIASFLFAAAATAQTVPGPPAVRATGEGVVYVKPDQAKIDIGVVTQAPTAESARNQNASQAQAVLSKLHEALGQKADIRTISYSLNPAYQYPKNGGKPVIDGYTATNVIEVTIDDLASVGKLIDLATAGGANEIQRLQFTLKDDALPRRDALRQAAAQARENAQAMANALGLKLGKVLLVEQSSPQTVRPMMAANFARVGSVAPTPIEAEPIEVRASLTLTVAVE